MASPALSLVQFITITMGDSADVINTGKKGPMCDLDFMTHTEATFSRPIILMFNILEF